MTIEADIIAWALERPGWQQDVLVDLAEGIPQGPDYIDNLVDTILAGTGRSPSEEAKRIRLDSPAGDQVRLGGLCEVRDVNALVDGQQLAFAAEGLTVVYGDNGSGKSGYARLIKTFVRARHRAQVLPDVFQPSAGQPSGVLDFLVAGQPERAAFPGTPSPYLLAVSFYDEHCGDEYLARESTISYRPSALTLLDGLVRVCDEVRTAITTRVQDNEAEALDLGLASDTRAGVFAAGLSSTTTRAEIDEAVTLPTGEVERLGEVLREEARLTSSDPRREQERLQSTAEQFRRLSTDLSGVISALAEGKTEDRRRLRDAAANARATAALVAARSFDDEPLEGIGSVSWRALWNAAREYSITEAYHDHEFPVTSAGAVCVLCQQPLSEGAQSRLERFEQYMTDTTERDARAAAAGLRERGRGTSVAVHRHAHRCDSAGGARTARCRPRRFRGRSRSSCRAASGGCSAAPHGRGRRAGHLDADRVPRAADLLE